MGEHSRVNYRSRIRSRAAINCLHVLLERVVDYAGLFPPAELPVETVVDNYALYLGSSQAWMLGRIIIPAGRLSEFQEFAAPHLPTDHRADPWRISALVPPVETEDFTPALEAITRFNDEHEHPEKGLAVVDAVEIKSPTRDQIQKTIAALPAGLTAFLEIPYASDPAELMEAIADSPKNVRAKIRTGGVTGDLIPTTAEVARFLHCCARARVGLKATAGLHHPLRGSYPLTYKDDSVHGVMHGFVNMLVAAAFAFVHDAPEEVLESILSEVDPKAFLIQPRSVGWREESVSFTEDSMRKFRESQFASFGSCSFVEPVSELVDLHLQDLT